MPFSLRTSRPEYDVCMTRVNKILLITSVSIGIVFIFYAYSLYESFSEYDDAFLYIEGEEDIVLTQNEFEKTSRVLKKWQGPHKFDHSKVLENKKHTKLIGAKGNNAISKHLLKNINCKLNVIPYNEIGGQYVRPKDEVIEEFLEPLKHAPFPVTIRWSKGTDIDAGCGQLATQN